MDLSRSLHEREMTAWLSLDHENVVKPHGWTLATEESKESIGFISAWCEEGDLHSYLRTHRPINRYELIRGISRGLTYLHERDVVHGDLKPCNIVMHNGIPKLWGYGLASIIDDRNTYAQESAAFTTLRYCAPELLNSDSGSRDKKTDVWAFGCTAGEVLYDKHPFQGIPISRLYAKLGVESPFDWDSQRYPDELKELVQGCLTRLPENRPSMESVRNALDSDFTARRRAQRRTRLLADLVEVQHCNLTGKIIIDEWDGRSYGNGFKGVYENDTVCVKTLKLPEDGSVTELARRFSREISVWLSLAHENVVKFHGWTLTGEGPICASLISAWSEGGNLKLHLKSQSINRYELIRGISRGLAYLHERDVVHGDLNPSNVVMHNGIPKLRDFGLFSIFDSSTTPALETSSLPYCAPELYNEKDLWDKQTDVWAFGCFV
ncbi:kinase-like domain-containing protein [Cantharellus anzutake]|uniref:kinase-like domain-containing protein n=1 Tax=Cantharellus anzutake TaxID=1750568 RepID=UPI0019086662|nr:kinase-like domain-containing protein [Cantharellus anzutake]KAF8332065.1 kinase-like domain-containing protein [Cantharellus anzutake]